MSDQQEIVLGKSDFEPGDDEIFGFTVLNQSGDPVGKIFMKPVSMAVMDRYRDILNGVGRRQGHPREAREFLFRSAFVRFEPEQPNAKLGLNGHSSEVDFF